LTGENIDEFLSIRQHFLYQNFPLIIFCRLSARPPFRARPVIASTRAHGKFFPVKIDSKYVLVSRSQTLISCGPRAEGALKKGLVYHCRKTCAGYHCHQGLVIIDDVFSITGDNDPQRPLKATAAIVILETRVLSLENLAPFASHE